jgi:HEAT repeat protein
MTDCSTQALIYDLDSMDHEIRTRAHNLLVALGPQAVETLIDTIRRAEGRKCWLAVHALAEIRDERVLPALIDLLDSQHVIVRQTVAEILGKVGDARAVGPLIDSLSTGPVTVQMWAATSLGLLGDPRAVSPLIDALQNTFSSTIRHTIIRALENIGDPHAVPFIVPFLEDDDPHVRSRSEKAIRSLSAR